MAIYNAKKLTVVKGDDTYIIDPLQGNESVYNDLPVTIHTTDWSGTAPYTYVFTDSHITANSAIAVYFKDGIRDGLVGDLKFTKATGAVTFVTDEPTIGDILLTVRVIDSTTNGVYPIDAEMVETDAVIGETTVQGALEDLDSRTQPASTTDAGIVQLSNTVGDDSTTKAATAYVTNVAYRRASNAITDLAATYSNSKTYSKGDYCTAYEKLYRANVDISTAEEWTSAHWDEVALADEINSDNASQSTDISTLKTNVGNLKSDIGIVEDTNSATHAITSGQYVIWKGSLYKASANISVGATLSTSTNLTAVSNGIANELNSNITNLESRVSSNKYTAFVDISTDHDTLAKAYVCPSDGYVIGYAYNAAFAFDIYASNGSSYIGAAQAPAHSTGDYGIISVFVKKGMRIVVRKPGMSVTFNAFAE